MNLAPLAKQSLKIVSVLSLLAASASHAQAAGALSATFRDDGRPFSLKDGLAYIDDQNGKTVVPYCRPASGKLRKAADSVARQGRTPTCPKKTTMTFVDAETKEPVAADRGVSEFSRVFLSLAPRVVARTTDAANNKLLAVILVKSNGGSGTFSYVAVANPKTRVGTNLVLLGDRVKVKQVQAKGNVVTVEYLDRAAAAPMSAEPTIKTVRRFQFTGEELSEVAEAASPPDAKAPQRKARNPGTTPEPIDDTPVGQVALPSMRSTIIALTTIAFAGCATTQSGSLSPAQNYAVRLRQLPAFKSRAAGKDPRETTMLMDELTGKGLPKLSDKQLLKLLSLNAKMLSKADESTCGNFARGTSTESERDALLKTLSARDQEAYHELRYLAAAAELADPPIPARGPGTEDEVRAAISAIEAPLPAGDRPVFESNLGGIKQLENPAACKTLRTFYDLILQAEGPAQATAVRTVLAR